MHADKLVLNQPRGLKAADAKITAINLLPRAVVIPAGCFMMGSPDNEVDRNTDESQHRVCVKTFKLTLHEITRATFRQFITSTGYLTDADRNVEELGCWGYQSELEQLWDWRSNANWQKPLLLAETANDQQPVTCVSYNDISAFIHWLNQTTGQEHRLPTEAEWEFAARANTSTSRYWGNNPEAACAYENIADQSRSGTAKWTQTHHCNDAYFFSAPVKHYHANPFGLVDMLGNVMEWTCSVYAEDFAGKESECVDEANAPDRAMVIRGGGWHSNPARVRSAFRNSGLAWSRQANLGFRLVRVR